MRQSESFSQTTHFASVSQTSVFRSEFEDAFSERIINIFIRSNDQKFLFSFSIVLKPLEFGFEISPLRVDQFVFLPTLISISHPVSHSLSHSISSYSTLRCYCFCDYIAREPILRFIVRSAHYLSEFFSQSGLISNPAGVLLQYEQKYIFRRNQI